MRRKHWAIPDVRVADWSLAAGTSFRGMDALAIEQDVEAGHTLEHTLGNRESGTSESSDSDF